MNTKQMTIYYKFVWDSCPMLGGPTIDYHPVLKSAKTEEKIQHKLNTSFSLGESMLGSDIFCKAAGVTGVSKYSEMLIGCYEAYSICQNSFEILSSVTSPSSFLQRISVSNFCT